MLNLLKRKLSEKGSCVGSFLCVATVPIMECLGYTGLDFVIIDTEHGPYDTQPMSDLIKAAELANMAPIVRVADVTHKEIQRAVDNGAQGIIVPCLRSVEDFKKCVALAKYPPVGNRGFIKGRGSGFGYESWASGTLEEFMANSNERVLVLPQCETKEALESIEEIVALDGLDGIFVGPFDLSVSLGIPGKFDCEEFRAAVRRIKSACDDQGKLCLIFTTTIADTRRYLAEGFSAVAYSNDCVLFTDAYRDAVNEIRK